MTSVPPAPSGSPVQGYGELQIRVWFTGDKKSPDGEVAITTPEGLPITYTILACEHLMRHCGQISKAGFERAMELLVEGAMEGRNKPRKKG